MTNVIRATTSKLAQFPSGAVRAAKRIPGSFKSMCLKLSARFPSRNGSTIPTPTPSSMEGADRPQVKTSEQVSEKLASLRKESIQFWKETTSTYSTKGGNAIDEWFNSNTINRAILDVEAEFCNKLRDNNTTDFASLYEKLTTLKGTLDGVKARYKKLPETEDGPEPPAKTLKTRNAV